MLASLEEEMKSGVGIPGRASLTDEGRSNSYGCPRVEYYSPFEGTIHMDYDINGALCGCPA